MPHLLLIVVYMFIGNLVFFPWERWELNKIDDWEKGHCYSTMKLL